VGRHVAVSIILLLVLLISSCQKSARQNAVTAAGGTAAAGQPNAAVPAGMPGSAPPTPPAAAPAVAPKAPPLATSPAVPSPPAQEATKTITLSRDAPMQGASAPARALANALTLMALDRGKRTLPEDFKTGPLGDDRSGRTDEDSAAAVAQTFLSHLVEGNVDRKLLAPDSESTLSDTLGYGLRQGNVPKSYRLGAPIKRDDGEVTATVRLFGAEGTSEGEIYLAKAGTQWLVSDLQLSLAEMAVKREKPKEKYFPSAYRWLLED
jgi:hypothetical protein